MTSAIGELWKSRHLWTPHKTSAGQYEKRVPGLFLTEFGYLNRPTVYTKRNSKSTAPPFHSEAQRATWYLKALNKAKGAGARMFSFYEMAEEPPSFNSDIYDKRNYADKYKFNLNDTGMVDSFSASPTGGRGYGTQGSTPDSNPRKAYCAIQRWMVKRHKRTNLADAGCAGWPY